MKKRKIPLRMCIGCRETRPKKELIRIVRDPQGNIRIDLKGKTSGRGAYLCSTECLEKAVKHKLLERALNQKIDEQIYESLKTEMNKRETGI